MLDRFVEVFLFIFSLSIPGMTKFIEDLAKVWLPILSIVAFKVDRLESPDKEYADTIVMIERKVANFIFILFWYLCLAEK